MTGDSPVRYEDEMNLSNSQSAALDWLRGLSAQFVLIGHAASTWYADPYIGRTLVIQNLGVVIFFVLSGFLIPYTAAAKPPGYSYGGFVLDRAARIYVPYVPCLLFVILADYAFFPVPPGPHDWGTILVNLAMLNDFPLHNYIKSFPEFDRVGTARTLWSVAAEWWIYLAFGAFYFHAVRRQRIGIAAWLLAIPAGFVVAFHTIASMLFLAWAAGALAAWACLRAIEMRLPWSLAAVGAFVLAVCRLYLVKLTFFDAPFALLLALGVFCLLQAAVHERWASTLLALSAPMGRALASFSYTLYLTHLTIVTALRAHIEAGTTGFLLSLIAANATAVLLYWAFERHYKTVAAFFRRGPLVARPVTS